MQYRVRDMTPTKFKRYRKKPLHVMAYLLTKNQAVITPEGTMQGTAGNDYLVIGTANESYIVKKDIFEHVYELAEV